jgi:hypothetical protein
MTTATGDLVLNFTGLADVDPYNPAELDLGQGAGKILSGSLRRSSAVAATYYRTSAAATADIITSRVELGSASSASGQRHGPAIIDASRNGYIIELTGSNWYLRSIATGTQTFIANLTQAYAVGGVASLEYQASTNRLEVFFNGASIYSGTSTAHTANLRPGIYFKVDAAGSGLRSFGAGGITTGPDYTQRKGSTFNATHTLGTITTATLNGVNVFDHVSSQAAGTVSFTGAITDERTTSGVVDLVLGDGAATQTQTVQVNVFGVVPSNNPAQKDGVALASLTNVQVRITSGTGLNGVQRFYSPTETTDASGNFSTLDLSSSVAADADPVLMHVLTAAGDSIISSETVGLI